MIIDAFFAIYCLIGAVKGRQQKLPDMAYRLIRNAMAMINGVSFFKIVAKVFSTFFTGFFANSLGFAFAFIFSFLVIRKLKRQLISWIEHKVGEIEQSKWGAILGFWTNFILGSAVIITASLSNSGIIHNLFSNQSYLARVCISLVNTFG